MTEKHNPLAGCFRKEVTERSHADQRAVWLSVATERGSAEMVKPAGLARSSAAERRVKQAGAPGAARFTSHAAERWPVAGGRLTV